MSGAGSRRRGHRFERDVANLLAETLDLDVVTARSVSGGTQAGADLVTVEPGGTVVPTVEGWSVECKSTQNAHQPTAWMRQAKRQADSDLYVVIADNPRRPFADSTCYLTSKALRWWLGDGLAVFEPDDRTVWVSFGAWLDLLSLDVPAGNRP